MKRLSTFALFYIGMAALLVARTLQRFYMIETGTGFFKDGFAQSGSLITAVSVLFAVVLMLMMRLSVPNEVKRPDKSKTLAVGAFCAAAGLFVSAVMSVLSSKAKGNTVIALLAVAFAIAMVLNGMSLKKGAELHSAVSLIGIAYCLIRLIISFTGYLSEVTVADSVFDIFTMCMLLLFFTADSKVAYKIKTERLPASFFGAGLAASLFCVLEVVPVVMALVMGVKLHGASAPDFAYAGLALYILADVYVSWTSSEQKAES